MEGDAFRNRPLDHIGFPYVWLDATYLKAREDHRIVSRAVVVATAVAADGNREVLDLAVGDSEDLVLLDSGDGDSVGVHHLGHGPLMDLPERVQLRLALPFEGFEVKL